MECRAFCGFRLTVSAILPNCTTREARATKVRVNGVVNYYPPMRWSKDKVKLLKAKEAAVRLNMALSTFHQNCEAMGLVPVELGKQLLPESRWKHDEQNNPVPTYTKSQLRWLESEIEQFIARKIAERDRNLIDINRAKRGERLKRSGY
jgi:hypothetical protein